MSRALSPLPVAPMASWLEPIGEDIFSAGLFPEKSSSTEPIPPIERGLKVPTIFGNGALISFTAKGGDVDRVFNFFSHHEGTSPKNAALLLDLALLHLILQRKEEAYRVQAEALEHEQLFRVVGTMGKEIATRLRVLALVAPGDFMNNAQIEFLLDGSDIGLDVLYLVPGKPLPPALPEHDVVFCAVNQSDENIPVLDRLCDLLPRWPRPVLNAPKRIKRLTRDGLSSLLGDAESLCMSPVHRATRADIQSLSRSETSLEALLPGASFPILIRPVGSHCCKNLEKIDSPELLANYLETHGGTQQDFFLTPFINYQGPDGLYRKYRVALIDGRPYLCHLALSEQWKIQYVTAGMSESASKRAEEARAMEAFDQDFAVRHGDALADLGERLGLDYVGLDCSELPDGRLLLFEAETAMVIHAMDCPTLFPYKQPQMAKVFAAFRSMIERASHRPAGIALDEPNLF